MKKYRWYIVGAILLALLFIWQKCSDSKRISYERGRNAVLQKELKASNASTATVEKELQKQLAVRDRRIVQAEGERDAALRKVQVATGVATTAKVAAEQAEREGATALEQAAKWKASSMAFEVKAAESETAYNTEHVLTLEWQGKAEEYRKGYESWKANSLLKDEVIAGLQKELGATRRSLAWVKATRTVSLVFNGALAGAVIYQEVTGKPIFTRAGNKTTSTPTLKPVFALALTW